ncbi:hypothetical protein, partial [Meiothermus cerbereus]|uniref:hypothetical protein n=1 Tax=Meiothermus cerbereus TaxID=65552 RepID=UPI003EEC0B45
MQAEYLTSADVARRMGVEGGTVRHYRELLERMGFPFSQDQESGAYLWTPELVEVARVAHSMAKAAKGVSFEDALRLILYAGDLARNAQEGVSVLTLLRGALRLPERLEDAAVDLREAASAVRSLETDLRKRMQAVASEARGELVTAARQVQGVAEEARSVVREAGSGGWIGPAALLLVALGVALPILAKGGLAALGPYLVVAAV